MKLDKLLVKEIAKIARLNLTEQELDKIEKDMNDVLTAFSKIQNVKTENVKMSIQPVEMKNSLREDKIKKSLNYQEALSQTNNKKDGYFVGPKAI